MSEHSKRCFVEYEIDLSGTEIKLQTPVLFKKIVKDGLKYYVIAELVGTHIQEYVVEIVQVFAMHYIPKAAKYIDSVPLAGGKIAHFFVQPKGASTISKPATSLLAHEVKRQLSPPREEDLIKQ